MTLCAWTQARIIDNCVCVSKNSLIILTNSLGRSLNVAYLSFVDSEVHNFA